VRSRLIVSPALPSEPSRDDLRGMIESPHLLEAAWTHAPPGREAAERNALLCEVYTLLREEERLPPELPLVERSGRATPSWP
jgi:hypothetical protein